MKNVTLFNKIPTSLARLFNYAADEREFPQTRPTSWTVGWLSLGAVAAITIVHIRFAYYDLGLIPGLFQSITILGAGYLGAELGSGFIHWSLDNYGSGEGFWGDLFHREFLYHHIDPLETTRFPTPITMAGPALGATVAILVGFSVDLICDDVLLTWMARAWSASFSLGMFTNKIHVWSHRRKAGEPVPGIVRRLQDMRLIIYPANHEVHHSGIFNKSYCLFSGLLNPVLDGIQFWAGLEWILARVFGINKVERQVNSK